MSNASDWESLLNGVFGSGGRYSGSSSPRSDSPKTDTPSASSRLPSLEDLQKTSKALDEELRRQAEEIAAMGDGLTRDMARDGLLPRQQVAQPAQPAQAAQTDPLTQSYSSTVRQSFEGLAEKLEEKVLGQPGFLKKLVMAFRRPFILGTEGAGPRNAILIHGPEGTGRHFALRCLAEEMAARGLLSGPQLASMDLSLYPGPASEKLFLQDLYGALNAPGDILLFDDYEHCHPGFLRLLADLVEGGSVPLGSRYVLQKGMLVEAGTALVPGAIASLSARGKYLVFFSCRGPEKLADVFGAPFVNALGDVCTTAAFDPASLAALSARCLNELAEKLRSRLGLTLLAGEEVRDAASACYSPVNGAEPVLGWIDRLWEALCQYALENDPAPGGFVSLSVVAGRPMAAFRASELAEPGEPVDLFALLPGEYEGALEEVRAEMDRIVGLEPVKEFVTGLADNVAVQQRRKAAGMKTAAVNMHMIFAGNPGTGKTTIARLVGRYLKAIGALRGGQLVEVSRADLVGRYVGHTAPLTNQVIESALGGVLFIDEAYSLFRGRDDSFGLEAIDTLVKGIEDHRDELVVILAGYSKEMAVFLEANSGLASRFPNHITFPDYTAEELWEITKLQAGGKGYRLAEDCRLPLTDYYARRQAADAARAGNGRLARNTLEAAILNQSRRLAVDKEASLELLLPGDFELED